MTPRHRFRAHLQRRCRTWREAGLPSRQALEAEAETVEGLKSRFGVQGLWKIQPSMLTATLDDGLGQGLELIERYAGLAGLKVVAMGLLQPAEAIVARCRLLQPDILGLTVLQLDSEDELARIGPHLPAKTQLIAGGAAFRSDPELALRCGVEFVAANLADFMTYLLHWPPPRRATSAWPSGILAAPHSCR